MSEGQVWKEFTEWTTNSASTKDALRYLQRHLKGQRITSTSTRESALIVFSSTLIHECIVATKACRCSDSSSKWELKKPENLTRIIDGLKEIVRYFVIDGPPLISIRKGQQLVVETVFSFFREEVLQLREKPSAVKLPALTRRNVIKEFDENDVDADRIACDAVCELTELQAMRLFSELCGNASQPLGFSGSP